MLKCIPASLHLYVVLAGLVHNGHQTVPCSYHPFGLFHTFPHSADADELPNTLPYLHRCLRTHPVRAFETLSPYAVLEVGIMAARDLTERESGFFNTDTTPDPYVQVILDDTELPGEDIFAAGFLRDMEKQKPRVKYQTIEEHERSVWSMRFGVVYL